jgi:exodeoxyribonuclease-3
VIFSAHARHYYQVITPGLADKVRAAAIYPDQYFSDHAPLIMDYDHAC